MHNDIFEIDRLQKYIDRKDAIQRNLREKLIEALHESARQEIYILELQELLTKNNIAFHYMEAPD